MTFRAVVSSELRRCDLRWIETNRQFDRLPKNNGRKAGGNDRLPFRNRWPNNRNGPREDDGDDDGDDDDEENERYKIWRSPGARFALVYASLGLPDGCRDVANVEIRMCWNFSMFCHIRGNVLLLKIIEYDLNQIGVRNRLLFGWIVRFKFV